MANSSDSVASHTQVFAGSIPRTHRFHRTHLVFIACICQSHRADGKLRGRVPFNVHKNKSPYATFRTRSSSIAPYVRKPLATTQRLKPKLQAITIWRCVLTSHNPGPPIRRIPALSFVAVRCTQGMRKKFHRKCPKVIAKSRPFAEIWPGQWLVQRWWGGKTCDVIDPELVRSEFVRPVPTQPLTVLRHLWAVPQLDVGFVAQLSS